jgi:hypothetical protein
MDKELIDGCFYVQQKKWGTWDSYTPDGKCIITALTESDCVSATRFILKVRQESSNSKKVETVSYLGEVEYKL